MLIQARGNVGAYAVQMARNAGLEVFATAPSKDLDYVRELGAATAIDYRETPFEDVVRAVASCSTRSVEHACALDRSVEARRHAGFGGVIANTGGHGGEGRREGGVFHRGRDDRPTEHHRRTLRQEKLVPQVGTVLPLADARVAHQMLAGAPHRRGKIVLNVAA